MITIFATLSAITATFDYCAGPLARAKHAVADIGADKQLDTLTHIRADEIGDLRPSTYLMT